MSNTIKGTVATKGTLKGNVYGIYGKDGLSAYEIAVKYGFKGTEKEWLDSLSTQVTADGTVVSQNADFAEVAEWADDVVLEDDMTGYFVCANVPLDGIVMKKATSTDDVKGVSISAPAFAGNYSKDKVDSNGKLLPKYSYVAIIGFVPVRDYGRCTVGGRCMPDDNGCAIPSSNNMGYQVVDRVSPDKVLIIIEPNGDMVQRIKTKVVDIRNTTANTIKGELSGAIVSARDVSPIEHKFDCKVESKNLFNPRNFADTSNYGDVIINEDGSVYLDGVYHPDGGTYAEITYTFEITEVCTLSVDAQEAGTAFCVDGKDTSTQQHILAIGSHTLRLFQGEMSSGTVYVQLEKGTTATPYTPYIEDLTSVVVNRCGKNLLSSDVYDFSKWETVSGQQKRFRLENLVPGQTYTISFKVITELQQYGYFYFQSDKNGSWTTIKDGQFVQISPIQRTAISFTAESGVNYALFGWFAVNTSVGMLEDDKFKAFGDFQLELGDYKTEYEPYIEPTPYTSNADGTVDVEHQAPNTTLISSNDGAVINFNYNIDTKTYIDNKFAELQALILEG